MYSYQAVQQFLGFTCAIADEHLQSEFSKNFFYANVCQCCSKFSTDINLLRCERCTAIFYCTEDHQKSHWPFHKDFCGALQYVMTYSSKKYIFQDIPRYPMGEIQNKNYILDLVQNTMGRVAHAYELNMFMFPKVCIVCRDPNPTSLRPCSQCPHANFCERHLINNGHEGICRVFLFSYYLDHYWTVFRHIPLEVFIGAIPRNERGLQLTETMDTFLLTYVKPHHPQIDFGVIEVRMLISKIFTRSLTVIYAIERLQYEFGSMLEIHVISKKKYWEMNFIEWEILFHWFPRLKFLHIVFIGAEPYYTPPPIQLCQLCNSEMRNLQINISPLMYNQYYAQNLSKPNLIVGFDIDSRTQITCGESCRIFTDFYVPIIFTAHSRIDLLDGIRHSVNDPSNYSAIEINPFSSLRPERSYRGVSFSNNFLSIYANLFPKINIWEIKGLFNYSIGAWMQVENMDTIQGQSHSEMIDDEKKEEAVIQDDKVEELAEVKEGEVAKKDDKGKNLIEEEKNLIGEESLIEEEKNLIEDENLIEEEKLSEEENSIEEETAYDIYESDTDDEITNDVIREEKLRNTNLKRKVKFYRNAIARLNKKNDGLDEIQNKLKELTEQYFDLESSIHEVRFFQ